MNKPLPEIVCQKCYIIQTFNGQVNCKSCGKRLNDWSVKSQLQLGKWEKQMEDVSVKATH